MVLGELACGNAKNRTELLGWLGKLPTEARHGEVLALLERSRLWGKGLAWVDTHLLAAVKLSGARLWTRDAELQAAAGTLRGGVVGGGGNGSHQRQALAAEEDAHRSRARCGLHPAARWAAGSQNPSPARRRTTPSIKERGWVSTLRRGGAALRCEGESCKRAGKSDQDGGVAPSVINRMGF